VVDGPGILVASMSVPQPRGKRPRRGQPDTRPRWQYHSRSDRHSTVGCWGVLFDLLHQSQLLQQHAQSGKVIFGVNFTMRDFGTGREKKLDLVIARPSGEVTSFSLVDLAKKWNVVLTPSQQAALAALPPLYKGDVGAVLMALEAKAAMTAFIKARPRLYDELNSSHLTIHGASRQALAVALMMVNASPTFISPGLNTAPPGPGVPSVLSKHRQPADAIGIIEKVREIPRRTGAAVEGYDGLGLVVVDAKNDNVNPVTLVTAPPAVRVGDVLHYDTMITRVANEYDTTFHQI
jgi:hypothetical protein